jgi:hypothetical protein
MKEITLKEFREICMAVNTMMPITAMDELYKLLSPYLHERPMGVSATRSELLKPKASQKAWKAKKRGDQ